MLKWVTLKDYGSINLTAATQQQADVVPRVLGSIFAFQFQFSTATATGAPAAANIIEAIVNDIYITDVNKVRVMDIQGVDVPTLTYNNSPKGVYTTPTTFSDTAATDIYTLYWPVRVEDQPLDVLVTLEALSVVSGGTTTVLPADFAINILYDDATDPAATLRQLRNDNSCASGQNDISIKLGQNLNTWHIALRSTATPYAPSDTNFTNVQLEGGGLVQVESMTVNGFKAFEAVNTVSGHQAGFYPLPISVPFTTTSATKLLITAGGSITVRLYQFYTLA
jgi:hypothetical protein